MPEFTAMQDKEAIAEFMDVDMFKTMIKESQTLMAQSDLILGVKREKKSFWKKVIDFLLFWRKKNNFTLQVMKNKRGSDGISYRMNIDLEEFKTEVL